MFMFAIIQIINPAGAAILIALPKTNNVLSKMDLTITFKIWGFLYGGISNTNEDGNPFRIVFDSNLEINSVTIIDIIIIIVNNNADFKVVNDPSAKNIVIIAIRLGNLPLHGTNELVNIAISLSLGESIILQPITPHALHPNPMHIERACFPWHFALLNNLSRLNAILGRKPESSSNVNRGKNIAIGGNITETTHAKVFKIPSTIMFLIILGICIFIKTSDITSFILNKNFDNSVEG